MPYCNIPFLLGVSNYQILKVHSPSNSSVLGVHELAGYLGCLDPPMLPSPDCSAARRHSCLLLGLHPDGGFRSRRCPLRFLHNRSTLGLVPSAGRLCFAEAHFHSFQHHTICSLPYARLLPCPMCVFL
ncbi:unnamed protein product [Ixodes pacificus]